MSFLRFTRWAFYAASLFTLLALSFSVFAWVASLLETEFWIGVFAMKAGLLGVASVAFVRLVLAIIGIDGIDDRVSESLLWGGGFIGAVSGIPGVMGGWMWLLKYPNWEVFLGIGLIGLLGFAVLASGVALRSSSRAAESS